MRWVKTLPCSVGGASCPLAFELWMSPADFDGCQRGIEAHHAGVHGLGNKPPDDTCIPMCDHHHDALTDRRGCFAGWPRGAVREWELGVITIIQRLYRERDGGPF